LLDVGTKPTKESFMHFYQAFKRNSNVGGEIKVDFGEFKNLIWNPLVAAQNLNTKCLTFLLNQWNPFLVFCVAHFLLIDTPD
jgi:cellulose synthase/poly-beta-1,6-N-acetylglucosamine synthase-like glycosyltransferase